MKKFLAISLSVLMSVTMLAGCGSGSTATPAPATPAPSEAVPSDAAEATPAPAPAEQVTIKVANWDTDTLTPYARELVSSFEAANPDIKVEILDNPSAEYTNKLGIMLNGGNDIDAFWIKDGDTSKGLAEKGQLENLNSYIERDGLDLSAFNGLAENFVMEDGSTIALPANSGFYLLYYNKDIFDAAGLPYPSNDMTWTEFETLAGQLTSGEGAGKTYGALIHTWQACVENWAVQDGKNTIMATDYSFMKPSYEMVLRMQDAGSIMDFATLKTGNIHYSSPFLQGQVAMIPMGSWLSTTIINAINAGESTINWGIATIPHPDDVGAGWTVGSVTPIAINAASTKKDAAWRFINYVCSEEGAIIHATYGTIPSRVNQDSMDIIANMEGMPDGALEAMTVKNIALDRPMETLSAEVNSMLEQEHSLIMLGEVSVDEGLATMAERSKEIQGQ